MAGYVAARKNARDGGGGGGRRSKYGGYGGMMQENQRFQQRMFEKAVGFRYQAALEADRANRADARDMVRHGWDIDAEGRAEAREGDRWDRGRDAAADDWKRGRDAAADDWKRGRDADIEDRDRGEAMADLKGLGAGLAPVPDGLPPADAARLNKQRNALDNAIRGGRVDPGDPAQMQRIRDAVRDYNDEVSVLDAGKDPYKAANDAAAYYDPKTNTYSGTKTPGSVAGSMVDGKFEPSPVQPVDEITALKEKREEYEEKILDLKTESIGVDATRGNTGPYQEQIDKINKEIENREYDATVDPAAPPAPITPPPGVDPAEFADSEVASSIAKARGTGPTAWAEREKLDELGIEWRP